MLWINGNKVKVINLIIFNFYFWLWYEFKISVDYGWMKVVYFVIWFFRFYNII